MKSSGAPGGIWTPNPQIRRFSKRTRRKKGRENKPISPAFFYSLLWLIRESLITLVINQVIWKPSFQEKDGMIIAIDLPLDKQYFFVLEAVIIETNELCEG